MNIEISPQAQHFIETQIKAGTYSSASAVIDALVGEKQNAAKPAAKKMPDRMTEEQHRVLMKTLKECQALSVSSPDDPFSGEDHDKILYSNY